MGEASHAGGEDFSGDDESGGVCAEVEEKLWWRLGMEGLSKERDKAYLGESEANKFAGSADAMVTASEDGEQQSLERFGG